MEQRTFTGVYRVARRAALAMAALGVLASLTLGGNAQTPTATAPATLPAGAPPGAMPSRIANLQGWYMPVEAAQPAPGEVARAVVIPIREAITDKTYQSVSRKVTAIKTMAADQRPQLVVFDMDTFGGEVKAALDISRLIKVDLAEPFTVCYVRTRAISAGAMIALSCDQIVMTSEGVLGDAAPIVMGGTLEGVEREKIESVLRNEFSRSAERNGYPPALAESMVSIDLEVWLVQNERTSELRFEKRGEAPFGIKVPRGVTTAPSDLDAEWKLLRVVVPAGKLLTLKAREAYEYYFAPATIDPADGDVYGALLKRYGFAGSPVMMEDTWSEELVELLTSPVVSGLLFFAAILFAYLEINTPGFGVFGIIALLCFSVFFGARFMTGLAQWWEIVLIVVGVALILLEVLVIPGFGIPGILGILLVLAGLLAVIIPNAPDKLPIPETTLDWSIFGDSLFALGVGLVAAVVAAMLLAQHLPKLPVARRLVLPAAEPFNETPEMEAAPAREVKVGDVGVIESTCRPVGTARFGRHLVDVISEGGWIDRGAAVRVLRTNENLIVVERTEPS